MPRPPRIQYENAHYHAYNRGNRRERIFRCAEDYRAFETFMLEAMNRSGVQLFDWSQLPNHIHLNLMTPDGNIAEFMQRLLTRYAKYFNFRYNLVGHLFQSRYSAKVIDQDAHFKEIIRYVELNPYRVDGPRLADLWKWRWSSLHYLLQPESAWPEGCRAAFRQVLLSFGPDLAVGRQGLMKFLADGLEKGNWEDFYRPKDGRFIGDKQFVEKIKSRQSEPIRVARRRMEGQVSLEHLLIAAEAVSGLTRTQLKMPDRLRKTSRWRQVIVCFARKYFRIPVVQLAKVFGRRESAISMIQKRSEKYYERWPESDLLSETLATQTRPALVTCEH